VSDPSVCACYLCLHGLLFLCPKIKNRANTLDYNLHSKKIRFSVSILFFASISLMDKPSLDFFFFTSDLHVSVKGLLFTCDATVWFFLLV